MNHTKIRNSFFGLLLLLFIGCEGEKGQIGPAGEDGTNGLNSLVNITNEPSGTNCENGGIKVEVGIDNNANGSLDTDEILATSYVCNGVDGNTSLTSVITEPPGANCENGGIKIDSGIDTNGDGTLDDTEITATAYVCNGVDGNNSLTKITSEAAGTNCENGGLRIDTGVDSDSDGTLDDSEINATAYTCNGLDGNVSLVNITGETAGVNCENGGVKIDSGVDDDGDGILDDEEIEVSRYICNGIDGGFDEQIRLRFSERTLYNSTTEWTMSNNESDHLLKFNKNNYLDADSIIVAMRLYTTNSGVICFGELYNITDGLSITNTQLESTTVNTSVDEYVFSENIFDDLPDYEIAVGQRIRSETDGTQVLGGNYSYIFIYRSN